MYYRISWYSLLLIAELFCKNSNNGIKDLFCKTDHPRKKDLSFCISFLKKKDWAIKDRRSRVPGIYLLEKSLYLLEFSFRMNLDGRISKVTILSRSPLWNEADFVPEYWSHHRKRPMAFSIIIFEDAEKADLLQGVWTGSRFCFGPTLLPFNEIFIVLPEAQANHFLSIVTSRSPPHARPHPPSGQRFPPLGNKVAPTKNRNGGGSGDQIVPSDSSFGTAAVETKPRLRRTPLPELTFIFEKESLRLLLWL